MILSYHIILGCDINTDEMFLFQASIMHSASTRFDTSANFAHAMKGIKGIGASTLIHRYPT